ncbi:MAG: hypothetical protein K2L96_03525 [Muribaculaceae bacterium]|nr:hypothetical protein [Muribaculaceae bacterium]
MKKKSIIPAIAILMAFHLLLSCNAGIGDVRDKNLAGIVHAKYDSISEVRYIGMSDVREVDGNKLQTVVIFYTSDSAGTRIERNARVTSNYDCSVLYTWEETGTSVYSDVKQKIANKLEEKGIVTDGSLIDALIEMKNH